MQRERCVGSRGYSDNAENTQWLWPCILRLNHDSSGRWRPSAPGCGLQGPAMSFAEREEFALVAGGESICFIAGGGTARVDDYAGIGPQQ